MAKNRLAQSYLFHGPDGVGKALVALRLGMAVLCEEGFGVACGVCKSCQKLLRGTHPDWHLIEPDGNNIRIDQIRELQSLVALRPYEGRRRLVIIDPADRMNEPAANALLKLLEEPPPDSLILLLTTMPQALLPTIRSRCQPMRFSALSSEDLDTFLAPEIQGDRRRVLLRGALGSPGRLRNLYQDSEWETERQKIVAWYIEEPTWDILRRLKFAEERDAELKDRDEWRHLWRTWQTLSRDRILLSLGAQDEQFINPDAAPILRRMPSLNMAVLQKRYAETNDALGQLQTNTSPRLIAESLLLSWLQDPVHSM